MSHTLKKLNTINLTTLLLTVMASSGLIKMTIASLYLEDYIE